MIKKVKITACLIAGLAVAASVANLRLPGYKHAVVTLGGSKTPQVKPIYYTGNSGKQVLALSIKNLLKTKDIEFQIEGAAVHSWLPPVIRMPFFDGPSFSEGKFKSVAPGKNLPVYIVFKNDGEKKKLKAINPADGSVIQVIELVKGTGNERHSH